jgi:hypothetical protein
MDSSAWRSRAVQVRHSHCLSVIDLCGDANLVRLLAILAEQNSRQLAPNLTTSDRIFSASKA